METGWFHAMTWAKQHYFYGNTHSACGRVGFPANVVNLGDTKSLAAKEDACGICSELAPLIQRFAKLDMIKEHYA